MSSSAWPGAGFATVFTWSVWRSVGSQPDFGASPESMTTWAPLCGGTQMSRS